VGIRPQRRSAWSNVEEFLKKYVVRWFVKFAERETLTPESFDPSSILVIRQHDQLGDFLLSVPAIRALRERFPESTISLLVREYFAPIARLVPYIDDVLVFQEDSSQWTLSSFRLFWRKLRSRRDMTVVLNTVSHSLTSDLFALLSRAKYTLGFDDKPFQGSHTNSLYNFIAPVSQGLRHQSERNLDIVRYIGCVTNDVSIAISVSPEDRARLQEECKKFGIDTSRQVAGIHIGAGKPSNRWPVDRFVRVAEFLKKHYDAQILLFWGPSDEEEELMRTFCHRLSFKSHNIGHPLLNDLAGYFRLCTIFLCNDTGVMHIAAGTGVQTLALFGPTNSLEWKPLNDNVHSIQSPTGNMDDIDVLTVEKVVEKMLAHVSNVT
jgi:ADP-heptose:LPS heptosyltransferase